MSVIGCTDGNGHIILLVDVCDSTKISKIISGKNI